MSDALDDSVEVMKRQFEVEKAEWERKHKKLKAQLEEKDVQLKEKDVQLEESYVQIKEKDVQIKEKDVQLEEKDVQIEQTTHDIMIKSLHSVLHGSDFVVEVSCTGSRSSHLNPQNHKAAEVIPKGLKLFSVIALVEALKRDTGLDPALTTHGSQLILQFIRNKRRRTNTETTIAAQAPSPRCPNEAAVAGYVNLALCDAATICNEIVSMTSSASPAEVAHLTVHPEMSIFSNRCDHLVVFDVTSNMPIFCVETKKHFGKNFDSKKNCRAFGQAFDQLNAMRMGGHPRPSGALTCFNQTYLTCLDREIDWNVQPNLQSLKATFAHLPSLSQTKTTPPPLTIVDWVAANDKPLRKSEAAFIAEKKRSIVRSKKCIDQKNLVSAFVIAILNALKGQYFPKPFQRFTKDCRLEVDCIRMNDTTYQWGKLSTNYKGPYQCCKDTRRGSVCLKADLYLLRCIGTGSTSKAFYAMTKDGYDCVVKLFVQKHDDDGTMKSKKQFEEDSKTHVTREVDSYYKIYKDELKQYVCKRKLNNMDCVITPFFEPVAISERLSLKNDIEGRLTLFTEHRLGFRTCDQSWRHIGKFNETLYLFDLGDLVKCKDNDAAGRRADHHSKSLMNKANASDSMYPSDSSSIESCN